jgi:hypothetical protein
MAGFDSVCTPAARRYAFWGLIALLAALTGITTLIDDNVLLVHDIYVLVDEYLENPKQVDMTIVFNETITFPNITICASMRQFAAPFSINASMMKTWDADLAVNLSYAILFHF